MITRKKRIIAIIIVLISLPMAFAFAGDGGGLFAYVSAVLLAVGVDMLFEKKSNPIDNKG